MNSIRAFENQADLCAANGAPLTALLSRLLAAMMPGGQGPVFDRLRRWPGDAVADALPLRLIGGLNALMRSGKAPDLSQCLSRPRAGPERDPDYEDQLERALLWTITQQGEALSHWLEVPPYRYEITRSAVVMAGLLALSRQFSLPFDLLELNAGTGLDLLMPHCRYELGGTRVPPTATRDRDALLTIAPLWRGPPPPHAPVYFRRLKGVDRTRFDLAEPAAVEQLLAYLWFDQPERVTGLERAVALAQLSPPDVDTAEPADWLGVRLAEPQGEGTMRVVVDPTPRPFPDPGPGDPLNVRTADQARIAQAMANAGARASADRPLGWLGIGFDQRLGRHYLITRSWPAFGSVPPGTPIPLAQLHPLGRWLDWLSG